MNNHEVGNNEGHAGLEFWCSVKIDDEWEYPQMVVAVSPESAAARYMKLMVSDGHPFSDTAHEVYVQGEDAEIFNVRLTVEAYVFGRKDAE